MRTLHLYVTRQVLATLGMTVFVFTLVLLLGNVLKEILTLLMNRQATLGVSLRAIALLIPYVLAFSLPMGMLTSTLLVFGRLSADQELTAARASGISLLALASPVLLVSVAVSALCGWLNFDVAPASRMAYKELLFNAAKVRPGNVLVARQDMNFDKYSIFINNIHKDGTNLDGVHVSQRNEKGELTGIAYSATGDIANDPAQHLILLTMHGPFMSQRTATGWQPQSKGPGEDLEVPIHIPTEDRQALSVPLSDMTFSQLRTKLEELKAPTALPLPARSPAPAQGETPQTRKHLRQLAADVTMPLLVYFNRTVSFSFACIGFTLIGIPLGIRSHRRETSIGVATALILVLIYYSFIILAQAWESHAERAPQFIMWMPNFLFQIVGAVLLWRSNQRG
jgi:lipopolysaccharide export system permease protein